MIGPHTMCPVGVNKTGRLRGRVCRWLYTSKTGRDCKLRHSSYVGANPMIGGSVSDACIGKLIVNRPHDKADRILNIICTCATWDVLNARFVTQTTHHICQFCRGNLHKSTRLYVERILLIFTLLVSQIASENDTSYNSEKFIFQRQSKRDGGFLSYVSIVFVQHKTLGAMTECSNRSSFCLL